MLRTLVADARYAARRLRARPTYSLLSVLTLALGIGGTAAIFGVARPLIFDPLPYAHADEVGTFWFGGSWTEEEFLHLRGSFPGFREVAAHRSGDVTMRDGDAPARLLPGLTVSSELFDVLGARPLIGRGLQQGDDAPGAAPAAVISYGLWQELGGTASVVGSRITLDDVPHTVVGVMPRGFWYPDPSIRVWHTRPLDPEGRNGSWTLLGWTAPGVDVHHLEEPLRRLRGMLAERFTYSEQWDKTRNPVVTPIRDELLGPMRPAIVATFAAMALILLIACANVAALMLGQLERRNTELAVRSALGATRGRIAQQLLVEALLLGVVAGLVGAAMAAAGFRVFVQSLPIGVWAENASFGWSIFGVALAVALVAVLLVVVAPAVVLWRGSLRDALSRARTGGIQGRGGRLEHGLVIAEVALAMLIVSGAALLVRSVRNLYAIDPGLRAAGVAVIDVVPSDQSSSAQRRTAMEDAATAVAALPGVRSTSVGQRLPLRGPSNNFGISIPGRPDLPRATTFFRVVTPGYFETLGIRLLSGRTFATTDRGDSTATDVPIVVNEALVRKYFPNENPLGKIVEGGYGVPQRIIGVIADVAEGNLTDEPKPARYYLGGTVSWWGTGSIVIRMQRDDDAPRILDAARRTVNRVSPSLAIEGVTTMQRILDSAVGPARQIMSLLAVLSSLALVLGAIGIYGVISHFATRRKRDWAIRVALGLTGSGVVRHVVGQGAALVLAGVVLGALGTLALARVLATFLFGVSAIDPIAFSAASAMLLAIGLLAAFVPARRAGRVDPSLVLREE